MFASEPQQTRYDLRFQIAGIPVRVHPFFWLMGVILGSRSGEGDDLLIYILIWVGVVFVSILVHELGHAFTMRFFGQGAKIVLYMMGGIAIPESSAWQFGSSRRSHGPREQILISAAGPAAGFLLAGAVVVGILSSGGSAWFGDRPVGYPMGLKNLILGGFLLPTANRYLYELVASLLFVNIFWGLMNLLPVYPLDGGQISRELLVMGEPNSGMEKSLWLSVIVGGTVAVCGLVLLQSFFLAVLFGFLAFNNYQNLQQFGGRRW